MSDAPFNLDLPSPIARLLQLRAGAAEAVVRASGLSEVQHQMAQAGALEAALWDALAGSPGPRLLVLAGSAGSGKTATMDLLLEKQRRTGEVRLGDVLADATHADKPTQGQAERLADFFRPFADGSPEPDGPCRMIAMNTGMALRFFTDLPRVKGAPDLGDLEALLMARLGLRPAARSWPDWLDRAVLVVNLDHRRTTGGDASLFREILGRLNPADPQGVLSGAERCATCQVASWCWPMANAALISSPVAADALDAAAADVALARGRQLQPRALWDAAAELALGGLPASAMDGRDPCFAIAAAGEVGDEAVLVHAMACNGALGPVLLSRGSADSEALSAARPGSLVAEIAERDPGYEPTAEAYELIAYAGLDPAEDGDQLLAALTVNGIAHPAVTRAVQALRRGGGAGVDGSRQWGRVMARAAWLSGQLPGSSRVHPQFAEALKAQLAGANENSGGELGQALAGALDMIELGLARSFGLVSGPEHYYPTSTAQPGSRAMLMVKIGLVDGHLETRPDPVLESNPRGSALVGYAPLTMSLILGDRSVSIDHPLWLLLEGAGAGATASALELERFLALRQAIGSVGVAAAAEPRATLLVAEAGGGRRFRITNRNPSANVLRATEVL